MKKLKNKFIIFIVALIFIVIAFQIFTASNNSIDTKSYVILVEGNATKNKSILKKDTKQVILPGDNIRTIGEKSIAVVEWGDGSITRLGGNTVVLVDENDVSEDLSKIKIGFKLLNGKTWSNVVSFLGEDSYFKEYFDDIEAGVRGTVFNVDLDKGYLNVLSHEVFLTSKDNKTITIGQNEAFSLTSFSFIDIQKFLGGLKDETWEKLNNKLDKDFIANLRSNVSVNLDNNNPLLFILEIFILKYRALYELDNGKDLEKIEKIILGLSEEDKQFLYKKINIKYQKLNFVSSSDEILYKDKLFYKKALLLLSSDKNKVNLVKYSVFDFKDMITSGNSINLQETISLLGENKEVLKSLSIDFDKILDPSLIPEGLKEIISDNFDDLKSIFGKDFSDVSSLEKKARGKIEEVLEGAFGGKIGE